MLAIDRRLCSIVVAVPLDCICDAKDEMLCLALVFVDVRQRVPGPLRSGNMVPYAFVIGEELRVDAVALREIRETERETGRAREG